jgi:hypothetical protein
VGVAFVSSPDHKKNFPPIDVNYSRTGISDNVAIANRAARPKMGLMSHRWLCVWAVGVCAAIGCNKPPAPPPVAKAAATAETRKAPKSPKPAKHTEKKIVRAAAKKLKGKKRR